MTQLITRKNGPFAEWTDLQKRLGRVFEGTWEPFERGRTLALDVLHEDNTMILKADVPGFTPEEVKVELDKNMLTITGEHEETFEDKGKKYIRRERQYGSFVRSITVPTGVDPDLIEATVKDGVLEVRIPLPEESESKTIEVKAKD